MHTVGRSDSPRTMCHGAPRARTHAPGDIDAGGALTSGDATRRPSHGPPRFGYLDLPGFVKVAVTDAGPVRTSVAGLDALVTLPVKPPNR